MQCNVFRHTDRKGTTYADSSFVDMIMLDITPTRYETLESPPARHMSPQCSKARASWFDLWVPHMVRIASEMLSHGPWRVRVCVYVHAHVAQCIPVFSLVNRKKIS